MPPFQRDRVDSRKLGKYAIALAGRCPLINTFGFVAVKPDIHPANTPNHFPILGAPQRTLRLTLLLSAMSKTQ